MNIAIINPVLRTLNPRRTLFPERFIPVPAENLPQINIVEFARALADLGNDVTVYAADAFLESEEIILNKRLTVCGIPTRLKSIFHPGIRPFTPSLAFSSKLLEADVIQSSEFLSFSTFFASHLASNFKIPFFVWQESYQHGQSVGKYYQQLFGLTAGRSIRAKAKFVLRTKKAKKYLVGIGVSPCAIGPWIPTGINGDLFYPRPKTLYSEDFGFPKDFAIMLTVARLSPTKGVDLAIRSEALLRRNGVKVGLLVLGSGPDLSYLKTLAKELKVEDCVHFLGHLSQLEVANLYSSSDLFLLASRKDLFPFALLEAGACGLPSVSTRVGCVEDFVQDGINGLLVSPNSVEELVASISKILSDDSFREDLGKAARRRFVEVFDRRVVAKQFVEVYQNARNHSTPLS